MVHIGDQVHTQTFAYLCVYATITDSDVPDIRNGNKNYDQKQPNHAYLSIGPGLNALDIKGWLFILILIFSLCSLTLSI